MPDTVLNDSEAVELLRVWASCGQQQISIATNVWEDPAAWGIMLVDLAKHIARSYDNIEDDEVLRRIKQGFDVEWESPTDEP